MRATPLQVGMQTRGEGDDTDACDKHRPPPWSFSVCIFSCPRHTYPTTWAGKVLIDSGCHPILILWLCVKIRIDTRCFVCFPSDSAGKNRNASHTADQRQGAWASYRQKPDSGAPSRRPDARARWTSSAVC